MDKHMTFRQLSLYWLDTAKSKVKGNTYAASYENPVKKHLNSHFGNTNIDEILPSHVQLYLNAAAEHFSADTVKKHLSCLRQIFDLAVEDKHCKANPARARSIKLPMTKPRREKSVYTAEQAELIYAYAYNHRHGAAVQFMLDTAVSRGELLAIDWQSIDLSSRTVRITQAAALVPNPDTAILETVIGEPKTPFRKRQIPLTKRLCAVLSSLPRRADIVFCNANGGTHNPRTWSRRHYDVFMRDMNAFYREQNIDVPILPPHNLRHTVASLWVNSGKNLRAIAVTLGHADLEMLHKTYAHSNIEEIRTLLEIE